jgi:hypothetical protein
LWLVSRRTRDGVALTAALLVLGAVTALSLAKGPTWSPTSAPQARWCLPGQTPKFAFGFADLSQHLGSIMGEATECEHGEVGSDNSLQETTTGLAVYDWCTNTPTFVRGQDHWMLVPNGVANWSDRDSPPEPRPTVRKPDLRHPCPP